MPESIVKKSQNVVKLLVATFDYKTVYVNAPAAPLDAKAKYYNVWIFWLPLNCYDVTSIGEYYAEIVLLPQGCCLIANVAFGQTEYCNPSPEK